MESSYHTRVLGEASASALRRFRESPLAYWHWANGADDDETESMRDGTACHMALHEPERFARTYVEIPNMPLQGKAKRESFLDCVHSTTGVALDDPGGDAESLRSYVNVEVARTGVNILTHDSLETLRSMIASLNMPCHRLARNIVARGRKELVLRWKDEDSGLQCKALLDSWDPELGILSDLKRTVHITQRLFRNEVSSRGYHYQLAWYRRGLRAKGLDVKYSTFVCGCPTAPTYYWATYDPPEEVLDACDQRHTEDLIKLAACLAGNDFPTINNGQPTTLQLSAEYI
jgi:hypothetical protein